MTGLHGQEMEFNPPLPEDPPLPPEAPPPPPAPPMEPDETGTPGAPPSPIQMSNCISQSLDFECGAGGPAFAANKCPVLKRSRPNTDSDSGSYKKLCLDTKREEDENKMNGVSDEENYDEYAGHRMKEFEILDAIDSDDGEDGESGKDDENECSGSDSDSSFDYEEIDAMLDEGMQLSKKKKEEKEGKDQPVDPDDPSAPVEKQKIILVEKGHDPFEVLPEGWVSVTHDCGMPVYLHRQTRVCTFSKPYFLGRGSVRKHDIPISSIPCLQYKKETAKEKKVMETEQSCQDNAKLVNSQIPESTTSTTAIGMNGAESDNGAKINRNSSHNEQNPKVLFKNQLPKLMTQSSDKNFMSSMLGKCPITKPKPATASEKNGAESDVGAKVNGNASGDDQKPKILIANELPKVKIQSMEEKRKESSVVAEEVQDYCRNLFQFKSITIKKFNSWKARRRHQIQMKKLSRPTLPSNTKLITCAPSNNPNVTGDKPNRTKELILNPTGKSYVCILHEYMQHAIRVQPKYVFQEIDNAQNPFRATVYIDEIPYGTGHASSKKQAKAEAAKSALATLIPEMSKIDAEMKKEFREDFSFFDDIKIEDPRVLELCNKAGQPSPHQILLECLQRNYGMMDTSCTMSMKLLKHQTSEFTMTVGKHTATVVCKNKREGKQLAAQSILQLLHPYIKNWGSILRLYGKNSQKHLKPQQPDEESVTQLQTQTKSKQLNTAILNKLRKEMLKLKVKQESVVSKGKLKISEAALPPPSAVPCLDA